MDRDMIFKAERQAKSALFTAHHYWAATVLNAEAPGKYREAAKAFRDFADVLDVYAMEFATTEDAPHE